MLSRVVPATFAKRAIVPSPSYERDLARDLRERHSLPERIALYDRFLHGHTAFDGLMRGVLVRAMVGAMGDDVTVGAGVTFVHPETFTLGDGVFLGAGAYLQGRHDGTCTIGTRTWIGPGAYFDARALELGEFVGWGPGAKVLGSEHTGVPTDVPVTQTDLKIEPVRVGRGADIGCNAILLPGVTVGEGAIVGAGAVVTKDVEPFAVVAGVPARPLKTRSRMK